jgi:hypothetical protein
MFTVEYYWEIEWANGNKAASMSLEDAIKDISFRAGLPKTDLIVVEIEDGYVEIYSARCKWAGALASVMEMQIEVEC